MNNISKDKIIEQTKQHIQQLRKNSPQLGDKDMRTALGKVICELQLAKKHDNDILKKIFALKK